MTESVCPKLADFGLALRVFYQDGSIHYYIFVRAFMDPPEMLNMTVDMLKSDPC